MKLGFRLTLLLSFLYFIGFAANVDIMVARQVATNFFSHNSSIKIENLEIAYIEQSIDNTPLFFIFNINHKDGFIIVSADDAAIPILAYSTSGNFIIQNNAINFQKFIDEYKDQIHYIRVNDLVATPVIRKLWIEYANDIFHEADHTSSVNPLLKTTWNQSPYYNELCPGGSVTGCGATAMAQVMKYYNYPPQGTGFHSYNHKTYGTISVNFGNTIYDWNNMPNNVTSSNLAVATLMYHCGVSQDMDYSPQTSTSGLYAIDNAFKSFFGYKQTTQVYKRENYQDANWISQIKTELDNARPVFYRGAGTGGGHFFILDGYDNTNYFHINWGWGGYYDGYFAINALNPGGVGTGGGTGGYNSGHYAIMGIQPEQIAGTYDLSLYSTIEYNPNPINSSSPFNVTVNIANLGTSSFAGDFCAAVFTDDGVFVDFVEILQNKNIQNGFYDIYTFQTSGIALIPGKHTLAIYYRPTNGEWILIKPANYTNPITINIPSAQNNMRLYSKMNFSSNPIVQNAGFSVTADVANYNTTDFKGWLTADIFDQEGKWVQNINYLSDVEIPAGFYKSGFQFANTGLALPTGSYYIAIFNSSDFSNWTILSNELFDNPEKIDIIAPALTGDIYENNNTKETAYNLPVSFSGNSTTINTNGSNLHNRTDYDFYKISLPAGFDYEIAGRVGDRFNSINGINYDADVLFSYDTGNGFSNAYDYSLPTNLIIQNGGEITFYISPYSAGETGSYVLDLNVTRMKTTATEHVLNDSDFKLFPNPSQYVVFMEIKNKLIQPDEVHISNTNGQLVKTLNLIQKESNRFAIDVSDMQNGLYFIQLKNSSRILLTRKLNILR